MYTPLHAMARVPARLSSRSFSTAARGNSAAMKSTVFRALGVALLAAACGSSTPSGTAGLAQTYCAKIEPCCAMANLPTDGKACSALFSVITAEGSIDSDAVDACTAAIAGEDQDAFCTDFGNSLSACTSITGSPGGTTGTVQPGGACSVDQDCAAASSGGTPSCVFSSSTDSSGQICVIEKMGVAGSTPCNGTVSTTGDGYETVYVGTGTPASTSYLCSTADSLYCDATTLSCLAGGVAGAACTDDTGCVAADYCADTDTGAACTARTAVGGACTGDSGCVSTAYCNGTICVALAANGAACVDEGAGCASGVCTGGVCVSANSAALPLYCGSSASSGSTGSP